MDLCVNCGIATNRCNTLRRRSLNDETILSVIRGWLAPHPVNSSEYVCQACWDLAQTPSDEPPRKLGHRNVCVRCGRSLASRVCHLLDKVPSQVYYVIQEWIKPRTIEETSGICHPCRMAADRVANQRVSGQSTSSQKEDKSYQPKPTILASSNTIVLPDYIRPAETERRCFIKGCHKLERYRVPLSTRKMLLHQFKCYVPSNNRLCVRHLDIEQGEFLSALLNSCVHSFTAKLIQDMMALKDVIIIDGDCSYNI